MTDRLNTELLPTSSKRIHEPKHSKWKKKEPGKKDKGKQGKKYGTENHMERKRLPITIGWLVIKSYTLQEYSRRRK
jgi:hypothetical protein